LGLLARGRRGDRRGAEGAAGEVDAREPETKNRELLEEEEGDLPEVEATAPVLIERERAREKFDFSLSLWR